MNLVSRLTLIAYIVGGWLLPAAHFHAHTGCEGSHARAVSVDCGHSHSHSDLQNGHSHNGHSHGGDGSVHDHQGCADEADGNQTANSGQRPNSGLAWLPSHSETICHGLCALCAARTLATATLAADAIASTRLTGDNTCLLFANGLLPAAEQGANLTRGPPALV